MIEPHLVAFTPTRAAQLSGLTRRQVDYWRKTLLLSPSTDQAVSAYRSIRLYDFVDMVALLTVAELLSRDVTLQRVRRIVSELQTFGLDKPLSQVAFGTAGTRNARRKSILVTTTLEDGTVVGDDDLGQPVIPESIDIAAIRARILRGARRPAEDVGRVEVRRATRGSREVFAGTRVPVSTVRSYLSQGLRDEEILEAFPAIEQADLDAVRVSA